MNMRVRESLVSTRVSAGSKRELVSVGRMGSSSVGLRSCQVHCWVSKLNKTNVIKMRCYYVCTEKAFLLKEIELGNC